MHLLKTVPLQEKPVKVISMNYFNNTILFILHE